MNQLRNWSYRVFAALVIAFNVLVVLSISMPAYGGLNHSGCIPNPCRTTLSCLKARAPSCIAPTTVKNCKCQCLPGLRLCLCLSSLPH
jgi:hypothetical protein